MARETEEVWRKRVERWKDSGLTAAEYGQETGLNPRTLAYWNWRLKSRGEQPTRRPAPKETPSRGGFIEVEIPLAAGPAREPVGPVEPLELVLGGGLVLRIPVHFDDTTLRRVVATLGGS